MSMVSHSAAPVALWTPLFRSEVEALLSAPDEIREPHLSLLSWLIWLPLLSQEELTRILTRETSTVLLPQRAEDVATLLRTMRAHSLIDLVVVQEPGEQRQQRRYYITDLGLYLFLARVQPSPPLSLPRLARAYPVERTDLLARLARPHLHQILSSLMSRLIAEGQAHQITVASYQHPFRQHVRLFSTHRVLEAHGALLLHAESIPYAFFLHIDAGSHSLADPLLERSLLALLDIREVVLLARRDWPHLLIVTTRERLALWSRLLLESSIKRARAPLAGGMTTLEAMPAGLFTPIWYDLVSLALASDLPHLPLVALPALLRAPASSGLVEQFSRAQHFAQMRLQDSPFAVRHLPVRLPRFVGTSLQEEAQHLEREQLDALFAGKRQTLKSVSGTGLLNLALGSQEKQILTLASHHPLLDLSTIRVFLPQQEQSLKRLQQTMTHLAQLHVLETRHWPKSTVGWDRTRYLLTPAGLQYIAIRQGEPASRYFIAPKDRKGNDEQRWRQQGTPGLDQQKGHTHGLYALLRQVFAGMEARGEQLIEWKSAHEAARWYQDRVWQTTEQIRPDAEIVFVPATGSEHVRFLLEYDRGTTGRFEYHRKFKAYLDFELATSTSLPLILVVTPSPRSAQTIRQELLRLGGSLQVVIALEEDVLRAGLTRVLFPL